MPTTRCTLVVTDDDVPVGGSSATARPTDAAAPRLAAEVWGSAPGGRRPSKKLTTNPPLTVRAIDGPTPKRSSKSVRFRGTDKQGGGR